MSKQADVCKYVQLLMALPVYIAQSSVRIKASRLESSTVGAEGKRKEKTTPFGVSFSRSQVLYRAAQVPRGLVCGKHAGYPRSFLKDPRRSSRTQEGPRENEE